MDQLIIYNLANKLKADAFWHVMKMPSGRFLSGQVIEVVATSVDGENAATINCQIVSALVEPWRRIKNIDWLMFSDVGRVGESAAKYYEKWWQGYIPDKTPMLALFLSKKIILPEPELHENAADDQEA